MPGGPTGVFRPYFVLLSSPTKPLLDPQFDLDLGLSLQVPNVDRNPMPLKNLGNFVSRNATPGGGGAAAA